MKEKFDKKFPEAKMLWEMELRRTSRELFNRSSIGKVGNYEAVEEEKIEVIVPREILKEVIEKVKSVHPHEEVAFDIYPIEN